MNSIIVSIPIYKPFIRINEQLMSKVEKILKKGYRPFSKKKIKIQEHNQFLMAIATDLGERKIENQIKRFEKLWQNHMSKTIKEINKLVIRDPELKNSIEVFNQLEKLFSKSFEGKTLTEQLAITIVQHVKTLFDNGYLLVVEKGETKYITLKQETIEFNGQDKTGSTEEIIDEMTLAVFGRKHVDLIARQTEKMQETLSTVIEGLKDFLDQLENISSMEKKMQMVELSSVFLGKILGIREPLNLAKKQIRRYIQLREEITEETETAEGRKLLELFDQWFAIHNLEEIYRKLEILEETISQNVDEFRSLHTVIENASISEKGDETILKFIDFASKVYASFEEFRFSTELFQDIPSFTTLQGGLLGETEKEYTVDEDTIIYVDTIFKSFQLLTHTVYAVRGIDLQIKRGEFVAIMGPSGSGKTTLLNLLSGLDKADRGTIIVDGQDMGKASEKQLVKFRRNKASFIYQSYNLLPVLTSLENVRLPSEFGTDNKIGNKTRRAKDLLAKVGLENFMNTSPKNLSGGQQQRVTIARALQNMPRIVFADEPTGDLDHKTGNQIMDILTTINKELGVTLVLVTHDPAVAKMADRIIHMQDGKIIKEEIVTK